ncbi:MAG TPA: hypothetical protein VFF09_05410 [archaeon]|nr:hypothetical protein [archaeon]
MILILDAAALLNNESFTFSVKDKYYTTSKVFDEWRDFRSKALAENAFRSGALIVQDPCPLSIRKTSQKCLESGTELGEEDISVVALAVEFRERGEKFSVITDDYSVQNILKKLKIKFHGVAQGEIIKHRDFRRKKNAKN